METNSSIAPIQDSRFNLEYSVIREGHQWLISQSKYSDGLKVPPSCVIELGKGYPVDLIVPNHGNALYVLGVKMTLDRCSVVLQEYSIVIDSFRDGEPAIVGYVITPTPNYWEITDQIDLTFHILHNTYMTMVVVMGVDQEKNSTTTFTLCPFLSNSKNIARKLFSNRRLSDFTISGNGDTIFCIDRKDSNPRAMCLTYVFNGWSMLPSGLNPKYLQHNEAIYQLDSDGDYLTISIPEEDSQERVDYLFRYWTEVDASYVPEKQYRRHHVSF